jgi:hypothetical protein
MEEAWGNPSGGGMARAGRSGRQAKRCPNWRAEKEEGKSPDRSATNQVAARRLQSSIRYEKDSRHALSREVSLSSKKAVQHEAHPQDEEQHEPRKKSRPH